MRKEEIEEVLRKYRGNALKLDEATNLLYSMFQKGAMKMARRTSQRRRDLDSIQVYEIPGLVSQNVRELSDCDVNTAQELLEALDRHDGDLTALTDSSGNHPIDHRESDFIGDAFLRWDRCPEEFRRSFTTSDEPTPRQQTQQQTNQEQAEPQGVTTVAEPPVDQDLQEAQPTEEEEERPNALQRFWRGFRSI